MTTEEVIKKLASLDRYMKSCKLGYVVTGTAGLMIQGALPENYEVHDIDIIIPVIPELQSREKVEEELKKVELLGNVTTRSSFGAEEYRDKVYFFCVEGVVVNAFISEEENSKNLRFNKIEPYVTYLLDGNYKDNFILAVHFVNDILEAKFKIGRKKDYEFYVRLVDFLGKKLN